MLKLRVITGLLLAAVLFAAVFLLPFALFVPVAGLVFFIGAWEWSQLAHFEAGSRWFFALAFVALMALCGWSLGFGAAESINAEAAVLLFSLAVAWWMLGAVLVKRYPAGRELWSRRWQQSLIGLLVIVPAWAALVFLRAQPAGEWLIVILVASVVCADTGAYFVGRRWGRRKLSPNVSPGKSREGFYGGFLTSLAFSLLLVLILGRGIQDLWLLALVLPASLASVLGDLLESMFKRERGVKDSGTLLPGHGGILDRIDSITAAAPVFALAYALSGWRL